MTENRKGEEGFVPFRTGRIFSIGPEWYFATREGDEGPYSSRKEAEAELTVYIRERNTEHNHIVG